MINKGREFDYRDFWNKNLKENTKGEELNSLLMGFDVFVDAKNLNEAISIVSKQYPENSIARENSSKVG